MTDDEAWKLYHESLNRVPLAKGELWEGSSGTSDDDFDMVKKPKHYMLFPGKGIEVRHVLEKLAEKCDMSLNVPKGSFFVSDYVQAMQYGMRFMDKGGREDIAKMVWYLERCLEAYDGKQFDSGRS